MIRFTIRDMLWLMVVVGLGLSLANGYAEHKSRQTAWEEERFEWLLYAWKFGSERAKASGKEIMIKAPHDWCVLTFDATGQGTLSPGSGWQFRDAKTGVHAMEKLRERYPKPE